MMQLLSAMCMTPDHGHLVGSHGMTLVTVRVLDGFQPVFAG
jgi:hypothetical protein